MIVKKKIIFGCDSRGDANSPYLTRWEILESKIGSAYLHRFHRSDAEEHHDHPWAFVSLILWRGYFEETHCHECDGRGWDVGYDGIGFEYSNMIQVECPKCCGSGRRARRYWPGAILFRRSTHRHRVVLVDDKEAWTFVVRGKYVREWGFFTKVGAWQRWKEYFKERGC